MCQSICNSSTETVHDDRDEIGGKEESIIEAGKVYNSRLNVVVYSLISGIRYFFGIEDMLIHMRCFDLRNKWCFQG